MTWWVRLFTIFDWILTGLLFLIFAFCLWGGLVFFVLLLTNHIVTK